MQLNFDMCKASDSSPHLNSKYWNARPTYSMLNVVSSSLCLSTIRPQIWIFFRNWFSSHLLFKPSAECRDHNAFQCWVNLFLGYSAILGRPAPIRILYKVPYNFQDGRFDVKVLTLNFHLEHPNVALFPKWRLSWHLNQSNTRLVNWFFLTILGTDFWRCLH